MIDKPKILRGARVQADAHQAPQRQDILIGTDGCISALLPPGTAVEACEPQDIARWTMLAAHLGSHELARAFDMASVNPARLMGLEADYGIRAGARADLLITDAPDTAGLAAGGALARMVMVAGRVVAGA